MRLAIVGVGQNFNFDTGQMEDVLQVELPDSTMMSVPTTNDAAQLLIQAAMKSEKLVVGVDYGLAPDQTAVSIYNTETRQVESLDMPSPDDPLSKKLGQTFEQSMEVEAKSLMEEGAAVFGGDVQQVEELPDRPTRQQASANVRMDDRSGVPSRTIARVDDCGNPVLAAPPSLSDEDDEDPGEQL